MFLNNILNFKIHYEMYFDMQSTVRFFQFMNSKNMNADNYERFLEAWHHRILALKQSRRYLQFTSNQLSVKHCSPYPYFEEG